MPSFLVPDWSQTAQTTKGDLLRQKAVIDHLEAVHEVADPLRRTCEDGKKKYWERS
jgi:hypothetical protein